MLKNVMEEKDYSISKDLLEKVQPNSENDILPYHAFFYLSNIDQCMQLKS